MWFPLQNCTTTACPSPPWRSSCVALGQQIILISIYCFFPVYLNGPFRVENKTVLCERVCVCVYGCVRACITRRTECLKTNKPHAGLSVSVCVVVCKYVTTSGG